MVEKEIKLKVVEAFQDDVNKGIIRIDSTYMRELDLRSGDVVSVNGERETVGIVDRAYIMNSGELLESGTPEDIINSERARKFYLGEEFKM